MFWRFCNFVVRFWFPSEGSVSCLCESRKVGLMKTLRFALYIGDCSLPITPPANQKCRKVDSAQIQYGRFVYIEHFCGGVNDVLIRHF